NLEALESYLAFGEALVAAGRATPPSLDGLLALPGVIDVADQDEDSAARAALESAMAASIATALDGLKRSRQAEGVAIEALLAGFIERIETLTRAADVEAG